MAFQPEKSELMHFTKGRAADVTPLRLGPAVITPVSSARFLGIWLNRKLNWKPQLKKLEQKLERQCRALTRIAASTWGCSLTRAREIYTKVIRSVIAYGAPAYHVPTEPGGNPQGCARNLAKHQSACLRTMLGAYKATPIRQLETEAAVPPLDLYLNYRLANFERRLKASGKAEVIRRASAKVVSLIRRRRTRGGRQRTHQFRQPDEETQLWLGRWAGVEPERKQLLERLATEWERRWRRPWHDTGPHRFLGDIQAADCEVRFSGTNSLKRHSELPKYVSSAMTQLRTGRVGLRAFLFLRRVPSVMTPIYHCGQGPETVFHLILHCNIVTASRTPAI